jgi:hypothetical protein
MQITLGQNHITKLIILCIHPYNNYRKKKLYIIFKNNTIYTQNSVDCRYISVRQPNCPQSMYIGVKNLDTSITAILRWINNNLTFKGHFQTAPHEKQNPGIDEGSHPHESHYTGQKAFMGGTLTCNKKLWNPWTRLPLCPCQQGKYPPTWRMWVGGKALSMPRIVGHLKRRQRGEVE